MRDMTLQVQASTQECSGAGESGAKQNQVAISSILEIHYQVVMAHEIFKPDLGNLARCTLSRAG